MTAIPLIPENAPFSAGQRAWLNGFFAGLFGDAAPASAAAPAPAEDFPWHDPTLELAERLKLAEGRPAPRRLMAAMAQMDCGQCGYMCQSYAEALAAGTEASASKCVPGGKETSKALKQLLAEVGTTAAPAAAAAPAATPRVATSPAHFRMAAPLNGVGSGKDTRHVVLDLNGSNLRYEVGDSFGVKVSNCPELVRDLLDVLDAPFGQEVDLHDGSRRPVGEAFGHLLDIARPSEAAIDLLARSARDSEEARRLKLLVDGEELEHPVDPDLIDLLSAFPSARPSLVDLVKALEPLQPRLYSIASSPKAHPGEVHLTVSVVRYRRNGRDRKGVASTFLGERVGDGATIESYVQAAHGFRLPENTETPIVMIGPGTGIAPFRAFLEERCAIGAKGRNWLFFGDRRKSTDFLYREQLESWQRDGFLTRLDTAFSRDGDRKVYVQDRIRENAKELWSWLQDGAHLYICGDAKHMARDVDQALQAMAVEQGGLSTADAKAYLQRLGRDNRYQRDVY
jgi:sulfite reductase (NADPH) flavoprotein alpha-component